MLLIAMMAFSTWHCTRKHISKLINLTDFLLATPENTASEGARGLKDINGNLSKFVAVLFGPNSISLLTHNNHARLCLLSWRVDFTLGLLWPCLYSWGALVSDNSLRSLRLSAQHVRLLKTGVLTVRDLLSRAYPASKRLNKQTRHLTGRQHTMASRTRSCRGLKLAPRWIRTQDSDAAKWRQPWC